MKPFYSLPVLFVVAVFSFSSCGKDEKTRKTDAVSFEEIVLNDQGFYNGSDGSGGFTSGNAIFKTYYNTEFSSWSGFAVSNQTDTITPDFSNQYSSIAGSGAGQTTNYAVLYSYSLDTIEFAIPAKITNIAFSNSTYAYYAMKNGNQFSKKFGGETGNDPDYFYLYLSVVDNKGKRLNFNGIPLADFTSSNNDLDFISKGWEYYNLQDAGYVKYLIFNFASSDTSVWGINTPTYVCVDNIVDEWEE
jgi:hypothetical protein